MEMSIDVAAGHARALAHNYRNGNLSASDESLRDYVATEMVHFMRRAGNARGVATDYDSWYAHATLNFS